MNWKYFLVLIFACYAFIAADPINTGKPNRPGKTKVVDFTLKDTTGKMVSLHDFAGKFVIISMEANWCGACLQEIGPTKLLQDYFLGRDVVWIFISFERDERYWAEARRTNQVKGIHLFGKPDSENLKKLFQFEKLPFYIWVDKNGAIAETDAPRPSTSTAKTELKMYLK